MGGCVRLTDCCDLLQTTEIARSDGCITATGQQDQRSSAEDGT